MKKGKLLYVQLLLFLAITAALKEGEAKKQHFRQKNSSKWEQSQSNHFLTGQQGKDPREELIYPSKCELDKKGCLNGNDFLGQESGEVKEQKDPASEGHYYPPSFPQEYEGGESDEESDEENSDADQEIVKIGSSLCTKNEFIRLKGAMLDYNKKHLELAIPNDSDEDYDDDSSEEENPEVGTEDSEMERLVSQIFAHFDHDHNGMLSYAELQEIGFEDNLSPSTFLHCHPIDFLRFQDNDSDGAISPSEFDFAFKFAKKEEEKRKVIFLKASVGKRLEVKCPLGKGHEIEWIRYDAPFSGEGGQQGSLIISSVEPLHAGNFSCRRGKEEQSYVLSVMSAPQITVNPHMIVRSRQARKSQSVELECRAEGEPQPKTRWLKNDAPLDLKLRRKYMQSGDEGRRLVINDLKISDTGAYICEGSNEAGTRLDIASLVVLDTKSPETEEEPHESKNASEKFALLHGEGITFYEPESCGVFKTVLAYDIIPGTRNDLVCGGGWCIWGQAIRVPSTSTYIYASQPSLQRLLVISLAEFVVVDVIPTAKYPTTLNYIPHLDQVWVQCKEKVQVVKGAGEKKKHKAISISHISTKGGSIFLPPDTSSMRQYGFGYYTAGQGLGKFELKSLKHLKTAELGKQGCEPEKVHFSSIYGFIIIQCRNSGHLILDALTDVEMFSDFNITGHSYLSPDSRQLITITTRVISPSKTGNFKKSRTLTTISVYSLSAHKGLEFGFKIKTKLNISSLAFFPSNSYHSYDIYASASDSDRLLFLDLHSGETKLVPGVGIPISSQTRSILAQRQEFGIYLVSPAKDAVYVINGKSGTVNCEVAGVKMHRVSSLLWV